MSPPTEQLIRDYLNRLSVAARGQLGPDDRRALVNRTRDFIERKAGLAGPPTALEVARLLSGLGDPSALVQQERQRLAVVRGQMPQPPAARNPITRMLRRDSAKPRSASWHWPAVAGSRTDLQVKLIHSDGTAAPDKGGGMNGTGTNGAASDGGPAATEVSAPYVPAQPGDPDWFFQALSGESEPQHGMVDTPLPVADDGQAADSVPADRARPAWPLADADGATSSPNAVSDTDLAEPGVPARTTASPAWQLTTPPDPLVRRQLRRALTATAAWCRRRPLEASAVALLGVGGAIYPPVWLLGAVVALPSRVWDGRDKWLGLALPLLLTVVAAALGVTVGGHLSVGQGMHEGWLFGVVGSRVGAVLSAAYLCWRSAHGRRPPAVPPWNRPHKVG
jgi:hypothetical protein